MFAYVPGAGQKRIVQGDDRGLAGTPATANARASRQAGGRGSIRELYDLQSGDVEIFHPGREGRKEPVMAMHRTVSFAEVSAANGGLVIGTFG